LHLNFLLRNYILPKYRIINYNCGILTNIKFTMTNKNTYITVVENIGLIIVSWMTDFSCTFDIKNPCCNTPIRTSISIISVLIVAIAFFILINGAINKYLIYELK